MKHAHQSPSPIKICLQDSIFRRNYPRLPPFQTQNQNIQNESTQFLQPISSFTPLTPQYPKIIDYINAQYFGATNNGLPFGNGIVIDDEMSFFLSSWENKKMNKLTLVKLLNETTLFGTWINGKMQGWNCFCIKNYKIFIQVKYRDNFGQSQPVFSTGLIIDNLNKVCYLVEISVNKRKNVASNHQMRLQVINRVQIPFDIRKEQDKNINLLCDKLLGQYSLKIPNFLSSLQTFMNHFQQNNSDIIFKQIPNQNDLKFFVSIQHAQSQNQSHLQSQAFNPYKQLISQSNGHQVAKQKQKKLGLLLSHKSFLTKSIGVFDSKYQLNGIGLTVIQDNTKLFGHFKSNLLTRQFNVPIPQTHHIESFKTQEIKNKLKHHHMKSLNFIHDIFYSKEVDWALKIANQLVQYVTTFQNEYKKRYGKAIDSFSASQQSFEAKYQIDQMQQIEITNKHKNKLNQNMQRRPFGKIVNSRSPLRSIPKSHSRSPSEIETFRQRRPLDRCFADHSPDQAKSQGKNTKNLVIHTHSAFNSRYNQQTSKNKSYLDSDMKSNISYKDVLEAKIRQAHQEDIVETVRRRTEFTDRISPVRVSQEGFSRQRRVLEYPRDRISHQRRPQVNVQQKCKYGRLERRDNFWK